MTISHLFPSNDTIDILRTFMLTRARKYALSLFVNIDPNVVKTEVPQPASKPPIVEPASKPPIVETASRPPIVETASKPPIVEPASRPVELIEKIQKQTKTPIHAQDSLFASIYLAVNGYHEYLRVCKNFGKTDSSEKEKIVTYLQKENVSTLKSHTNYNLTKTLHNKILQDLSTQPIMPIHCVTALVLYHKCSIYIVDVAKNIYLSFKYYEEDCPAYILYKEKVATKRKYPEVRYKVDACQEVMSLHELKDNMYEIVNYDKPLKGISTFKMPELKDIANKLHIQYDEKIKKNELYEKIGLQCIWD